MGSLLPAPGALRNFDIETAKKHSGAVCLREFRDNRDQGHWSVSWNGWVLQTFDASGGLPDVNWDYKVEQSHNGGYYEYMVMPWDWLPITEAEYYAASEAGEGQDEEDERSLVLGSGRTPRSGPAP